MQRIVRWIVEDGGERLDRHLAQVLTDYSRSAVQKLIAEGVITVNSKVAKAGQQIEIGDVIECALSAPESGLPQPEPIPLDVIYEDRHLLVINKPAGLVVHPGAGRDSGTLVNAILAHCPELTKQGGERPGIVHRLDQDTSGLIVVAKNVAALEQLQGQFKNHQVEKVYLALLEGTLQPMHGLIDAPIGRDPRHRQRMAVVTSGGRPARTAYRVREYLGKYTFVEARPETGRTHQIRVHFAAIGYPVVGDPLYGRRKSSFRLPRQFLHAWQLTLVLPPGGERRTFTAPLPHDLQQVLETLKSEARKA